MKIMMLLNLILIFCLFQCSSEDTLIDEGKFEVVIDVAHGGKDPGAKSKDGNVNEKDIALQVSNLIYQELNKENITSILTRSEDEFISLWDRIDFVNKTKPKLLLSIHVNGAKDSTKTGYELFYKQNDEQAISFIKEIQSELNNLNILKDNGSKTGPFSLLKDSKVPSLLIELCYISNANDLSIITDKSNQEKIAKSLAKAIKKYKNKEAV